VKSLKASHRVFNRNTKNLPASQSGNSNVNSCEHSEQHQEFTTNNPIPSRLKTMGVKRPHAAMAEQESNASASAATSSPIMSMFEGFRAELDEHHDRRERIIKASRDITASSKKM
jgi:hypothetical protein